MIWIWIRHSWPKLTMRGVIISLNFFVLDFFSQKTVFFVTKWFLTCKCVTTLHRILLVMQYFTFHLDFRPIPIMNHSRPQSPLSFWPAAGIEGLWKQPFQAWAIDADHVRPDGQNSVTSFVISKWLLPELSIPAAGQKDGRLWGRE